MVANSNICSNSINLPILHLPLITKKTAPFRAADILLVKTTLETLRNGELFLFKQHNFAIFRYNSTKLNGKVYILLLNSCVKFYATICTQC